MVDGAYGLGECVEVLGEGKWKAGRQGGTKARRGIGVGARWRNGVADEAVGGVGVFEVGGGRGCAGPNEGLGGSGDAFEDADALEVGAGGGETGVERVFERVFGRSEDDAGGKGERGGRDRGIEGSR